MSEKVEAISLTDIAKQFSSIDDSFDRFHAKLFSFIPPESERFVNLIRALDIRREVFPNRHPAFLLFRRLGPLINIQSQQIPAIRDGQLTILMELNGRKLPDCDYLALVLPIKKNRAETRYTEAFKSIQFLRSFIALSFGALPFYTFIDDFDFDLDGKISFHGPVFRMPLFADFLKIIDIELLAQVTERLALQQDEFRQRLQRGSSFFERAMNHDDGAFRFAAYWIALEIITGGKGDAIRRALCSAYNVVDRNFRDRSVHCRTASPAAASAPAMVRRSRPAPARRRVRPATPPAGSCRRSGTDRRRRRSGHSGLRALHT